MKEVTERKRPVTWEDPTAGVEEEAKMSGLGYLRAIARGDLPSAPMAELIGFDFSEIEEGRVVFECTPAQYHYNPIGTVHGGLACTLFDSAMGCAVHTMLPTDVGYTTVELKVNFLRPITLQSGRLRCEGTAIHVGSHIATAEARLFDTTDKLYGHATTTCMIFGNSAAPEQSNPSAGEGGT